MRIAHGCLHAPPEKAAQYGLRGPQVQPDASYWHTGDCPTLCVVRPEDVVDDCGLDPYTAADVTEEILELHELASLRDDPTRLADFTPGRERMGISPLLQLRPPASGTTYNRLRLEPTPAARVMSELEPAPPHSAVFQTGRELARAFENEPPGVHLRHAVDVLVLQTGGPPPYFTWSPPYIALVHAALGVALYSGLLAAWHVKWRGGPGYAYRPRPYEYDPSLPVLFDRQANATQSGDGAPRAQPMPSPGTPRHPAYPSGHSTTYAAAVEVLAVFFPSRKGELDMLADNAGIARLWAGIHYRSDHVEGVKLGRCVGRRIVEQLEASCICPPDPCAPPEPCQEPPTPEEVMEQAERMQDCCCGDRGEQDDSCREAALTE